jgi:prepilin-type N-terminal cleavage/methylation domain-containing protein
MTSNHQTIGDVSSGDAGSRTVVSLADTGQNSFSLVELLVVVAILSVLSSILTPTLKRAHSASREILCSKQKKRPF